MLSPCVVVRPAPLNPTDQARSLPPPRPAVNHNLLNPSAPALPRPSTSYPSTTFLPPAGPSAATDLSRKKPRSPDKAAGRRKRKKPDVELPVGMERVWQFTHSTKGADCRGSESTHSLRSRGGPWPGSRIQAECCDGYYIYRESSTSEDWARGHPLGSFSSLTLSRVYVRVCVSAILRRNGEPPEEWEAWIVTTGDHWVSLGSFGTQDDATDAVHRCLTRVDEVDEGNVGVR